MTLRRDDDDDDYNYDDPERSWGSDHLTASAAVGGCSFSFFIFLFLSYVVPFSFFIYFSGGGGYSERQKKRGDEKFVRR